MNTINHSISFALKLILTSSICLISTSTFAASLLNLSSATASSELREANLTIDGDSNTRWESIHNIDPSYLIIGLDQSYSLDQIVISWEAANAKTYDILGSTDAITWTTLSQETDGSFGDRTDTIALSGNYQYIKINATSRSDGNPWGYSIWEVDIYGDEISTSTPTPTPTPSPTPTVINTPVPVTGSPVALYDNTTELEAATQEETNTALITRFSDRPRTRHAREDQYQSYDHFVAFYFENRSSNIEIIDTVAKGGTSITMNVRTLWPLSDTEAENRWWYWGQNTVAHYAGNGVMEYLGFDGTHYNYTKTDSTNRQFDREIRIGDRLEFEISQFSRDDIPRGQINYYGTTFLYIVGEGIVPWYTENAGEFVEGLEPYQEDSRKIPESYWLGGNTTLSYQYTDEPNDHFIQMATNLGYDNGQTFLLGRRVHHSSTIDGSHDETEENGIFDDMVGKTGSHYVNESCTSCHDRNGSAPVVDNGELLDRWIFKVGDANGNPDANIGRVLQSKNASGSGEGEGDVSIASWTELSNGLRTPNYTFSNGTPTQFSARIAPRLVGMGLLEAIPEDTILALADPDDSNGDGISGRVSLTTDPEDGTTIRLGRFGWKATTTSVKHQVASALNTDMGVMTSLLSTLDCGSAQSDCESTAAPLDDENLDNLTTYISLLGVRAQRGWKTGTENATIVSGKQIFTDINCTSCHVETLQTSPYHPHAELRDQTIHPYTDMLVHDMGEGLADNLAEGNVSGSEWRTTPLWGLGLSACVTGGVTNPTGYEGDEVCTPHHAYLHDGRARSIEEAILWHGGEAEASTNAYQALSTNDQNSLLEFLNSL